MRIWSIHPKYMDAKGLVALWRETLLAKHVLEGATKGYTHHPQLTRFKASPYPLYSIHQYLAGVYAEATLRGYHFDKDKIDWNFQPTLLQVTVGQMAFERLHLLKKLSVRDEPRYNQWIGEPLFEPHPLFCVVEGDIEVWEIQ